MVKVAVLPCELHMDGASTRERSLTDASSRGVAVD